LLRRPINELFKVAAEMLRRNLVKLAQYAAFEECPEILDGACVRQR
jgi:hypothetical protein